MNIKFGISKTINIGNFENLKPSIEIEDGLAETYSSKQGQLRVYESTETPEECYERLSELGNRLLGLEVEKINNSLLGLEHKEKDEWVNKYNKIMHKEL